MSYLRPLNLQPPTLKQTSLDCWIRHLFSLIRNHQIISRGNPVLSPTLENCHDLINKSDYNLRRCLGLLYSDNLASYVDKSLPMSFQEEVLHRGIQMLRKELCLFDMFPAFFCLLWRPKFAHLDIPPISESQCRIAVLEFLTTKCDGEQKSVKFRLFESTEINIEESYLMKRVLRRLSHVKTLVLWWAGDDQMLNIIGDTCHSLEALDLWR